ncbi:putative membrane protein [Halanaeroarchaeum sp. HSR-CO]|uniref:DUF63 family protein n=1 Tax=Halanaeroarchaeum sp. HSR-CO TaxID=2866382 RepID=UPI00217D1343|nr:DUF63 family protein [Halanaeroarchaeum sp. HSR-CO]UWG48800.1 putative membrane protein [Halanaeroarchaeum sp. HSR-CO]
MVLPAGSTIPPLPQTVLLLAALAAVVWALRRAGVTISDRTILALSPWMVAGATAYVVSKLDVVPAIVAPFFGSPAVYGTTFVFAGTTWLVVRRTPRPLASLGGVGVIAAVVPTAVALWVGMASGRLTPVVPLLGVAGGAILAGVVWKLFETVRPADATTVGLAGPLVFFAHALDGVSTAVGIDLLGFGEQSPLSRLIMEAAGALPTADLLGVGWLFVLVKLGMASVVLWLLAGYVREEPAEGFGLLGLVIAVGLGPGAHNVLLFIVLGPSLF